MRVKRISFSIMLLVISAVAQDKSPKPGEAKDREIFLIRDHQHQQWCGYTSKSESESEAERVDALTRVEVKYSNGRVLAVRVRKDAESGDWMVEDKYSLDPGETFQTLSRMIGNFTLGIIQEELHRISAGKTVRQSITSRVNLSGDPAPELTGYYLPNVPIATSLQSFPFWYFIRDKRQEVLSKGSACVPDSPK